MEFTRGLPPKAIQASEFTRGLPPKAIQAFLETNPLYEVEFSYSDDPETEEISLVSVKVDEDVVLRTS